MIKYDIPEDIVTTLNRRMLPTITLWNRLEPRPRAENFDRALKAEIRDPLWMLTKQWQTGEFQGDDAGSPAFAKIQIATTKLTKYRAAENLPQFFDDGVPLEAMVEQKKIPFIQSGTKTSVSLRILMGRHWLKMIKNVGFDLAIEYIKKFGFINPAPEEETDAAVVAHKEVWQKMDAIAGRAMDGYAFYEYLKDTDTPHLASDPTSQAGDTGLDDLGKKFTDWFERIFLQPQSEKEDAWQPDRMEYQFKTSAPEGASEKILTAAEYYHGHLDWYNLDIDPNADTLPVDTGSTSPPDPQVKSTRSFLPAPLRMNGMPNNRWWEFEDRNVNLNDIKPDTTDLNKLLFIEFSLLNGNDWFHLPFTVDAGSIVSVKGLSVTNVFGEKVWIEASGTGLDDDWKRWNMYALNIMGEQQKPADNSLLILPTVQKIQEGKPLEEITFIRDEVANMVWGIERRIQMATGEPKNGKEAANELTGFYQRILDKKIEDGSVTPGSIGYSAAIRYEIMNTVPENWIPFIPVRAEGTNREVRLQRASMPRILVNDTPGNIKKIKPRTQLLREGLDDTIAKAYFINEEEIPRAGVNVYQTFQRARWYNGKVVTWLGARKHTGRGEGSSGLAFDKIIPVEKSVATD